LDIIKQLMNSSLYLQEFISMMFFL